MEYLLPIAVFVILALAAGALLTFLARKFPGGQTEKEQDIRGALPGMNCGMCGFSGCDGYAHAIAENGEACNRCVPGGEKTAKALAEITGTEAQSVTKRMAVVACRGHNDAVGTQYEYRGVLSCAGSAQYYNGQSTCLFGCLGFGDCAAACPEDAIHVVNGCAVVDPTRCVGCGICARTCPKHLISVVPADTRVLPKCSSHSAGAVTNKTCKNGCIGCKKCERICEHDAIHVTDFLAVIDSEKCIGCGKCAEACPKKVLELLR